ncbi:MAG: N-acetyl-gamma-glutamyl-phosphate reductase [Pseudomonadota bacterium]
MSTRVFIDGAAGTTGLEIHDRLKDRTEFDLIVLDDAQRKDEAARRDALHEADIAILCLPDDAARAAVKLAEGSNTRIIDASSAHRVAEGWTYGFPEIIGSDTIADAQFVSNPGCYPTGFLALMTPLTHKIPAIVNPLEHPPRYTGEAYSYLPNDWPYTVNAVSGYSGGGNAMIRRFGKQPEIAYRAYGLAFGHKHLPEMQRYAELKHAPVFSPSVVPAFRGMIVEVPLPLKAMGLEHPFAPYVAHDEWYEECDLVRVFHPTESPEELLLQTQAEPWDGIDLYSYASPDGEQVRLIARLDNLGKGASGAAIQNLNIMCGLPETTGLRL